MKTTLEIVSDKKQLREFIFLPRKIHKDDKRWVPPLYGDEWKFHSPDKNRALAGSETVLFLARKHHVYAGRIMGIINTRYNAAHGLKEARFFKLECINDKEVSHTLLNAVENWAVRRGMEEITGPFGFSDKDPEGLQIEGFDYSPVIATATNFPYLRELVESAGYSKKIDCLVYKLDVPADVPANYQRVYERIIRREGIQVKEFRSASELKPFILPVLRMVNDTYKDIYGFVPLDEKEMRQLAAQYLPVLDPDFTKVVTDSSGDPIAFIVASPDISEGIRKAKGRIFPVGFIHILQAGKKSRQLNLYLGAVKNPESNAGIIAILGMKIFSSAIRRGMKIIDSHLILETNKPMRAVMERLGAQVYKRYRIYTKGLI